MQPGAVLAPAAELAGRIAGLQAGLAALGLDAALLQQNADLFYFAGTVQQSYLYVPAEGEATLFVRKVAERARLESALGAIVELPSPKDLPGLIADAVRRPAGRRSASSSTCCPSRTSAGSRSCCRAWSSRTSAGASCASARSSRPGRSSASAPRPPWPTRSSRLIPGLLEEGLTEVEFAGRVEAEARRLGHEGYIRMRGFNQEMFYGQLLTGVSGCVPSYLDTPLAGTGLSPSVAQGASFRRIGRGEPIVFDFVPVRDGYMADFTRMYSLGPLDAELLRAYDAALRVQEAATGAARPGATCRAVWEAALAAAAEAGLAANFMGTAPARCPTSATASASSSTSCRCSPAAASSSSRAWSSRSSPSSCCPAPARSASRTPGWSPADGVERLTLAPQEIVDRRLIARRAGDRGAWEE